MKKNLKHPLGRELAEWSTGTGSLIFFILYQKSIPCLWTLAVYFSLIILSQTRSHQLWSVWGQNDYEIWSGFPSKRIASQSSSFLSFASMLGDNWASFFL